MRGPERIYLADLVNVVEQAAKNAQNLRLATICELREISFLDARNTLNDFLLWFGVLLGL